MGDRVLAQGRKSRTMHPLKQWAQYQQTQSPYVSKLMRIPRLNHLLFSLLVIGSIASCNSKPKPQAKTAPSLSPAISITTPINKARDAKITVEQVGKQREQLNPEAPPTQP